MPPAVSLAKAIVNPQLIENKPNQTKNKTKKENETERANFRRKSVPAKSTNSAQCCWHTVMHTICSPGHSSAVELPTMNILLFLFPFLFLPCSCPHTTSLMALMKLTDLIRSSWEPQTFSEAGLLAARAAHFGAPELLWGVAPCSQSDSLWSPRASLQAWLLAARPAHFGAPELLCKRGSLQPELLTLELQSFSASVVPRGQSCSLRAPELLCKRGS